MKILETALLATLVLALVATSAPAQTDISPSEAEVAERVWAFHEMTRFESLVVQP